MTFTTSITLLILLIFFIVGYAFACSARKREKYVGIGIAFASWVNMMLITLQLNVL